MDNEITCLAIHDAEDKCQFFKSTPACQDLSEGLIDYTQFLVCSFGQDNSWIGVTLCVVWLLFLFVGLGVTADDFLCPSLVVITKTLRLSQNIAGVTFLAFGNGAPDLFSSIAGAGQNRPSLVVGTLLGAGVFVTSVVVGSIIAAKPFKIMERPFLRDVIFYLFAAFWAFLRFYYEELTLWHSLGFIILYLIYIVVVVLSRVIYNRYKGKEAKKIPVIEIQGANENQESSVTFKPSGFEDDPEAEGVVLRRFSFRGSISLPKISKKRSSASHSHHEHIIKAITGNASIEERPNPAFKNGLPPPLDTQISKTSLSSLLSSSGELSVTKEFLYQASPIDIEAWPERSWKGKVFETIKAPICFFLILTVPVVDYENPKNNWCRYLNVLHCLTVPMFTIFGIQKYDLMVGPLPLWSILLLSSIVLTVVVFFTSSNDESPMYHSVFGYVGFITSVIWIYIIASEIVSLLKTIGLLFKLSDAILGLTVLAWGNSIGDFISNLSVARQGYPRMGISACYGGPLLNLLLGLGIPFTIYIAKHDKPLELEYEKLITLLYTAITVVLLTTIMTMTAMRFQAKQWLGYLLIGMYFVFLTVAVLLETNVI